MLISYSTNDCINHVYSDSQTGGRGPQGGREVNPGGRGVPLENWEKGKKALEKKNQTNEKKKISIGQILVDSKTFYT